MKMTFTDKWPVGRKLSNVKRLPRGRQFPAPPDMTDWESDQGGELIDDIDAKIDFSGFDYDAANEELKEGDRDEDDTMEDPEPEQTPAAAKKASSSAAAGAVNLSSELDEEPVSQVQSRRKRGKSSDEEEYVERPKGGGKRRR